jgi:hypothetical protein
MEVDVLALIMELDEIFLTNGCSEMTSRQGNVYAVFKILVFTTSANNFRELICQCRSCFFGVFAPMLMGLGQYVEKMHSCISQSHVFDACLPDLILHLFLYWYLSSNFCLSVGILQSVLCIFVHVCMCSLPEVETRPFFL